MMLYHIYLCSDAFYRMFVWKSLGMVVVTKYLLNMNEFKAARASKSNQSISMCRNVKEALQLGCTLESPCSRNALLWRTLLWEEAASSSSLHYTVSFIHFVVTLFFSGIFSLELPWTLLYERTFVMFRDWIPECDPRFSHPLAFYRTLFRPSLRKWKTTNSECLWVTYLPPACHITGDQGKKWCQIIICAG